jgi:translation initiation factor IF-2
MTFIDTPGHEAFAKIRSRGAGAADIAVLVVGADDSVKPQTIESIEQIKAANIPMVVAINKIDLPGAMVDKVKSDLAKHGVQVEGFGGDVPFVPISAKKGTGVVDLLELLLLVFDMKGITADIEAPFEAVVIEAKVDKFRGTVATLLVKVGTLTQGKELYENEKHVGKVRAMVDENGAKVDKATPSQPVVVLGFSALPSVGAIVADVPHAKVATAAVASTTATNAADFLAQMTEADKKKLKLIIKADAAGSLEAIREALPKDQVDVVRAGLGDINEADILEGRAVGAVVVGFNVKAGGAIERLAREEKVVYRIYNIIYTLLEEMEDVVEGMEQLLSGERELGKGTIIAEFPFDHDRIAGTKVLEGRLAKGDRVRVMRGEVEVGSTRIKSIRQGKNEVNKVEVGGECGILFDKKVDFTLRDDIIPFTTG